MSIQEPGDFDAYGWVREEWASAEAWKPPSVAFLSDDVEDGSRKPDDPCHNCKITLTECAGLDLTTGLPCCADCELYGHKGELRASDTQEG